MSGDELRRRLRDLPVLAGSAGSFDPAAAPDHPAELFLEWLIEAIESGAREPHAMTLSTVDAEGHPNSRVLILKGLEDGRWTFATSRASRKGDELSAVPWVAANFYWPELGRQVRLRGPVLDAGREESARDFLERPIGSRAASLLGTQSQILDRPKELEAALRKAQAQVDSDPGLVPDHWSLFHLVPEEVEFWQADPDRRHVRLRYELIDQRWAHRRLWP